MSTDDMFFLMLVICLSFMFVGLSSNELSAPLEKSYAFAIVLIQKHMSKRLVPAPNLQWLLLLLGVSHKPSSRPPKSIFQSVIVLLSDYQIYLSKGITIIWEVWMLITKSNSTT